MNKQESELNDEIFDLDYDLFQKLGCLISSNWDSQSLKLELERMHTSLDTLRKELFSLPGTKSSLCPSCNCTVWHDYFFCPKCGVGLTS